MVSGRKKQQGSSGAAATPEKKSGKGKGKAAREDGKERAKEKEVTGASKKAAKGKEPAKEKQKEARGDGKKGRAKAKQQQKEAAAAKSAGQQFFKIFFSDQSGQRLKIPASFHQHLKEQPTGLVSLKGPSGNTWQAVLTSDSEGLFFGQGWKEFVMDHSVKQGVVDPPALIAKPTNDVVIKIEDDEEVQGDMDAGGTSDTSVLPPKEGNGKTRKRTRGVNDLSEGGNASKRHSSVAKNAEKKRPEAIPRTSKDRLTSKDASTIDNTEKGTPFRLLDESTAFNKTQVREKNMPKLGKFIVRRARQPVVISQRRPVTQEEKDLALKRAKEFKSENPFAVQTMMESYVYVGFFMNITCEFVRESLPRTSKKMTLWDPLGKPWEVNYVYYSGRSVASFSGGWGKFALGNNLEKFDVCVFELFKEDNIRVHIYRVVSEITPLLRASSKD
ncbi:hypothetical protein PVAP13_8NG077400 [Panicum virgatum]|uniref:TF-B3 domain-containing protein n=1 Tax=Panicum virgatum TaxID=38727 RepID=A0A8T0P2H0_PANVG|nr:hypothetical protein PVAP13_8NG077400 [Panicum virgatum]